MAHKKRSPRRFEVHWVNVPVAHTRGTEYRNNEDKEKSKENPRAWVVVSDEQTQRVGIVIAVPLTRGVPKSTYQVAISASDITQVGADTGTPDDSVACCEHVRALAVERFGGRLGKLDNTKGAQIEESIMRALSLPV